MKAVYGSAGGMSSLFSGRSRLGINTDRLSAEPPGLAEGAHRADLGFGIRDFKGGRGRGRLRLERRVGTMRPGGPIDYEDDDEGDLGAGAEESGGGLDDGVEVAFFDEANGRLVVLEVDVVRGVNVGRSHTKEAPLPVTGQRERHSASDPG